MTTPAPLPYGTPQTPRLAVLGEAHLDVDPEIAHLHITITARGTDRRTTLDETTRRNRTALDLIRGYGDAVEKVETSTLTLAPETAEKSRRERVRSYLGTIHLTATVNDFTALGELATRLADLDLTRVEGPWWALRPDSPVHGEARQQAVREAVRRAREYATALGAELTALVELADTGAENERPLPYPAPHMMRTAFAGTVPDEAAAPLDLQPQRQSVHAQVSARFTMTPPAL
ncbi:SIMPL domain-containing protein [Streptomyces gamaensis]|uniref:SIMPL domain-containing protein n=1 Tax=Streptomyces gamaensis TaxID=1763542 RepID=A0ABW0Z6W3_9ACTN